MTHVPASNFVRREIDRCNRNLLYVNSAVALMVVFLIGLSGRYLLNFAFGPFRVNQDCFSSDRVDKDYFKYYVTLKGMSFHDTGYRLYEHQLNPFIEQASEDLGVTIPYGNVTAKYLMLSLGNSVLLVQSPPKTTNLQFTGTLRSIPDEIKSEYLERLEDSIPRIKGHILPVMLDATEEMNQSGYVLLVLIILSLIVSIRNILVGIRRGANPVIHPIWKGLSQRGAALELAANIDAEYSVPSCVKRYGRLTMTPSWLIYSTFFGLDLIMIKDVIWTYQKITRLHVPMSSSYSVVLRDNHGRSHEFDLRFGNALAFLLVFGLQAPWVLDGYDKDLDRLWDSDPSAATEIIRERRKSH